MFLGNRLGSGRVRPLKGIPKAVDLVFNSNATSTNINSGTPSNDDAVSTWVDLSNGSNDALQVTAVNQPTWKSDTPRLNFDGTSDNLNLDALITPLASTTTGTWSAWVRPVDATPTGSEIFISFGDTDAETFIDLFIQATTGKLVVLCKNAAVNQWVLITDAIAFSDNTWTHIAMVQDGSASGAVLYIDSVAVAQTFLTDTDKTFYFNNFSGVLDNGRLGCLNFNVGGDTNHFNGDIQQAQIYSSDLSAAQIAVLKNYNPPA